MRIAIIGSGNTATVLGKTIVRAGHVIEGIYSRTLTNAQLLAGELNAQHCGPIENITQHADIYIVAVPDDNIMQVAYALQLPGKVVVHTSGSTPKIVLAASTKKYGVLYPLQSLRRQATHLPVIPLLIDGSDPDVSALVKNFAQSISGIVEEAGDEKRLKLHVAAVMVSNFTNHLYSLTESFCSQENIPFKALTPLIQEVAERTANYQPSAMQTGPAVRGDKHTIEKHLQLLSAYPLQQKVYEALTESIIAFYQQR